MTFSTTDIESDEVSTFDSDFITIASLHNLKEETEKTKYNLSFD